jgi:hypothetical protein
MARARVLAYTYWTVLTISCRKNPTPPWTLRGWHLFIILFFALNAQADWVELSEARENNVQPDRNLPKVRLLVDYGPSLLIKSLDSTYTQDAKDFMNDSFLGTNLYLEGLIYPWPRGGLGVYFATYESDVSAFNLVFYRSENNGNNVGENIRTTTKFTTFGPMFSTRMPLGHVMLHGGVGAGYYRWRQKWLIDGVPYLQESDTYTVVTQVGGDLALFRAISVGINIRLWLSSVRKFKVNGEVVRTGEDENVIYYNSLNRLEATAGLRFGL